MGIFEFIFGKKKSEDSMKNQSTSTANSSKVCSGGRTIVSSYSNENINNKPSVVPFVFESNQHQRYENEKPVQGLQECPRIIKVEKNVNGCSGYQLKSGDGYIIRMINGDTGQPQMSAKPMRVIKSTADEAVFRGYMVSAQTPFGYQDIDMADYGLTVSLKDGKVVKCVLHMYDRYVDIEYRKIDKVNSSRPHNSVTNNKTLPEAELLVTHALSNYTCGKHGDETYHPLYKAWKSICNNPKQLREIQNYGNLGLGMMIFLSYGTVQDIDDLQQISSISYLFLSLALKSKPKDVNLLKNRLILMLTNTEAFGYTISSVVNKNSSVIFMNMSPFKVRDSLFKMEFADLSKDIRLDSIDMFLSTKQDISNKIQSGLFGNDKSEPTIITEGENLHADILDYLSNKVLKEENVEF